MRENAFRGWADTFFTNGLILVCGVATGILAARLLLPEGRGALAAVLVWPQFVAALGFLSLSESVTYHVGSRPDDADRIRATAFWLALALSPIVALVGFIALPHLLGPARDELVSVARAYLVAFVPFNFVALGLLGAVLGKLRFKRYNRLRTLPPLVYLMAILALWAVDRISVRSVVWGNWAGTFIATIIILWLNREGLTRWFAAWKEAVGLIAFGWRFHIAAVLLLVGAQVDRLVVLTMWDNESVGLYMAALSFASAGLGIVSHTFHTVLFPSLSRRSGSGDQGELLARGVRFAMLGLVCMTVPLILASPWAVPFLFGESFQAAVAPAMVLLVAYVLVALRHIVVRSLRGIGEARAGTVAETLALGGFLFLAWPLGRHFGLSGVGLAITGANIVAAAYLYRFLRDRFGLELRAWWGLDWSTSRQMWRACSGVFREARVIQSRAG